MPVCSCVLPPPWCAENGVLSFQELCRKVIQPDYTRKMWTEVRDDEDTQKLLNRSQSMNETVVKKWPTSLKAARPTLKKLRDQLATKILERTKRANDQYREGGCGTPSDGGTGVPRQSSTRSERHPGVATSSSHAGACACDWPTINQLQRSNCSGRRKTASCSLTSSTTCVP